jgi:hypothetical protein
MGLLSRIHRRQPGGKIARGNQFRPRLECLEDRTLLSTLTVLNNHDSGADSLRATINAAHNGDTIVFDPSLSGQTITLTSDQLTINKSLDIEGPGANKLAVSGNDTNRVFSIDEGFTVAIAGLTITHGRAVGGGNGGINSGGSGGGGILNYGSALTLAYDVLSNNEAVASRWAKGGAIYNPHQGTLTVTESTFIGNKAIASHEGGFAEGGAIWDGSAGSNDGVTALVIGCTFMGNQATGADGGLLNSAAAQRELGGANGGALHNEANSTLTVENSTFTGNQAIAGNGGSGGKGASAYFVDQAIGGAIANDDGGILVVTGCTFSSNEAIGGSNATAGSSGVGRIGNGNGGAILSAGLAWVTQSTFDHNEARGGSANSGDGGGFCIVGRGAGGAIYSAFNGLPVTLIISNCTCTNNHAIGGPGNTGGPFAGDGVGGGLLNQAGATATIGDSTFTGNRAVGGQGNVGQEGGNGLGGALANFLGSTVAVSGCTFTNNQAAGGAGGSDASGGNGFGGAVYNDGQSVLPSNAGTPAILEVHGSTISDNDASGGAAGCGGSRGLGEGGGVYLRVGGTACLDAFTAGHVTHNHASTSDDDVFGVFSTC